MHHLGATRTTLRASHFLHTLDAFVRAPLPGMEKATAIVHVSPALGARFAQVSVELEPGGSLGPASGQRFVYVLEGRVGLSVEGDSDALLQANDYVYVPSGTAHCFRAEGKARIALIEKPYVPLAGLEPPKVFVGSEGDRPAKALLGDEWLQVRALLPDEPAFDFAVNTMEYQPGAALSMVEAHVMEHGLLMLAGGGIYRLGDAWYPVTEGDFIWMAPYCPQWFGALGKTPAKYLIYKDWNRFEV